jgi:hypothetical protein
MTVKAVTVHVPEKLTLEQSQKVLATILGKAGHPNCFSGFKIGFQSVVDPPNLVMTVDKGLKITEVGG